MLTTRQATELLKKVWEPATIRIWQCGNHRSWKLPDPQRLPNGRLGVPKLELEKWLVRHGWAEYTEL